MLIKNYYLVFTFKILFKVTFLPFLSSLQTFPSKFPSSPSNTWPLSLLIVIAYIYLCISLCICVYKYALNILFKYSMLSIYSVIYVFRDNHLAWKTNECTVLWEEHLSFAQPLFIVCTTLYIGLRPCSVFYFYFGMFNGVILENDHVKFRGKNHAWPCIMYYFLCAFEHIICAYIYYIYYEHIIHEVAKALFLCNCRD